MTKLYSKKSKFSPKLNLKPKKETVSFLLRYSRAFYVIDTPLGKMEIILN